MIFKVFKQWHIPKKETSPVIVVRLVNIQYGQCFCGCGEKSFELAILGFGFFVIIGGIGKKREDEVVLSGEGKTI